MDIFERVYELEKACFDEPWNLESLRNQFSNENNVFSFYEEDGKMLGYAFGTVIIDEGELYRIAVSHDARSKGYGEFLLKRFVEKCRAKGAEKIFLEVRSRNVPARRLYEKVGFNEISLRKRYYADDDAVIYFLEIV